MWDAIFWPCFLISSADLSAFATTYFYFIDAQNLKVANFQRVVIQYYFLACKINLGVAKQRCILSGQNITR